MKIHFLISGDIRKLTGGSIYNSRIIVGLRELGHEIIVHQLADDFPFPSEESINKCKSEIAAIMEGEPVVIDGLVFGVTPGFMKELHNRNPVIPIIHLLLTENPDFTKKQKQLTGNLEKEALRYASKFVVTSNYSRNSLLKLGVERDKITVVIPGIDDFPRKRIYAPVPSKFLCVSNYTPLKGHMVLVRALINLKNEDWELHCYGNPDFNRQYVDQLIDLTRKNDLSSKVHILPTLARNELTKVFLDADLFIHPSIFETYGMALTEALSHGLPVVASTAAGITQTVPKSMGMFFEPGNPDSLSLILYRLIKTPLLYRVLCNEASGYYKQANS